MLESTTIQFYQLLTTPLQVALTGLVAKAVDGGYQICITAEVEAQNMLSNALWEQGGTAFLPNCDVSEPTAEHHHIIFSAQPSIANNANVLIITNMLEYDANMPKYDKILFIFNGNVEHELTNARGLWKKYQEQNYQLIYFKQSDNGGWQKI
jgi:DNA polymerase-3 subunit chi